MNNNDLPRMMDAKTIKKEFFSGEVVLNLTAVYSLFHRDDFPKIKVGKKMFVATHLFLQWLEKECNVEFKPERVIVSKSEEPVDIKKLVAIQTKINIISNMLDEVKNEINKLIDRSREV